MAEEEDDGQLIKIAGLVLGLVIMAENLLVIVTVFVNKKLHTTTYVYIGNLAVADTLAGVMFMFMYAGGLEFDAAHKTIWFLKYGGTVVSLTASLCSLLSVAVDRCLELSTITIHSHLGDPKRRRRCIAAVILTWLVAIVIGSAPILGWNCLNDNLCSGTYNGLSRNYLRFVFAFVLSILLVIYVLYFLIYHHVQKTAREVAQHMQEVEQNAQLERQTRLQKTLMTVLGVFTICWLPWLILVFVDCVCDTCNVDEPYDLIIPMIALINSGMNPVIYALRSKEMRSTYSYIICCCGRGRISRCACCNKRDLRRDSSSEDRGSTETSWLSNVLIRLRLRTASTWTLSQDKGITGEELRFDNLACDAQKNSTTSQENQVVKQEDRGDLECVSI